MEFGHPGRGEIANIQLFSEYWRGLMGNHQYPPKQASVHLTIKMQRMFLTHTLTSKCQFLEVVLGERAHHELRAR